MGTWWRGTSLVFQRGLLEQLRSKTFRLVAGLLLVLSAAAVTLPQLIASQPTTYTLATVGKAPAPVVAALDRAADTGQFDVRYVSRDSATELQRAVRIGDATAALADGTLYVAAKDAGTFPAVVAQTVVALETAHRLADLGLSRRQIVELQSIRPPRQVTVAAVEDEGRTYVGVAVGIVLYLALLFGGNIIATTVATEKSSRISEVLLPVLRPSQILAGTVLAVGTVTFTLLVVLTAPVAVAVQVADRSPLPPVATGDIALGVVWFVLGFALFAFLYAATGALVDKVTDVGAATAPLAAVLVFGYMLALFTVMGDPGGPWSALISMFPLTAPLAMPFRWATGEVPVYQLVLAMGLTGATAVAAAWLASMIYRRALVITGHRVRLRELMGGARSTG